MISKNMDINRFYLVLAGAILQALVAQSRLTDLTFKDKLGFLNSRFVGRQQDPGHLINLKDYISSGVQQKSRSLFWILPDTTDKNLRIKRSAEDIVEGSDSSLDLSSKSSPETLTSFLDGRFMFNKYVYDKFCLPIITKLIDGYKVPAFNSCSAYYKVVTVRGEYFYETVECPDNQIYSDILKDCVVANVRPVRCSLKCLVGKPESKSTENDNKKFRSIHQHSSYSNVKFDGKEYNQRCVPLYMKIGESAPYPENCTYYYKKNSNEPIRLLKCKRGFYHPVQKNCVEGSPELIIGKCLRDFGCKGALIKKETV